MLYACDWRWWRKAGGAPDFAGLKVTLSNSRGHLDAYPDIEILENTGAEGLERAPRQPGLEAALVDCHAVVTWASAIAARALVAGVPVLYEAPSLICAGACRRGINGIEAPRYSDRLPALERLAWAQWSLAEIESGLPFARLRMG